MGDIGAEPSMEEILSSIKRIIAEEDTPAGRRRTAAVGPPRAVTEPILSDEEGGTAGEEGVLELSEPLPPATVGPEPAVSPPVGFTPAATAPEPRLADPDPILSPAAADATRGALQSLSRLMVKPEPTSDGTLEGLVRDMLRPMLREWLDANLPDMVEAMVAKEIQRISGGGR